MSQIEPGARRFHDTGNPKREKENFHGLLFADLDFSKSIEPISFFRSDFRQVKVQNVGFFGNNFDRADFIDAYIASSSFTACQFGTDFLNTYFDRVTFSGNSEDTCTIAQCVYNKCTFHRELFKNTTFRTCKFIECVFEDCIFEMNTADEIAFESSEFHRIDFSNMTAVNFAFSNCIFFGLKIDPDYLGTYFFKGQPPEGISYSYKGEELQLGSEYTDALQAMVEVYVNENRYFEAFNSAILFNTFGNRGKSLRAIFKWVVNAVLDEPPIRRINSLSRLIDALVFYSDSEAIALSDLFFMIGLLTEVPLISMPLTQRLEMESRLGFLKELTKENLFAPDSSRLANERQICFEVVADEGVKDAVDKNLRSFFQAVSRSLGDTNFQILGIRHGSLIFECVATGAAVVLFTNCLRLASSNLIRVALEFRFSAKYFELLESARTTEQVAKVYNSAKSLMSPPTKEASNFSNDLAKLAKEIRIVAQRVDNDR